MKTLLRSRYTWLAVLAAVILGATILLAAVIGEDTKVEDLFNYDLYNSYLDRQVGTAEAIVADYEWQQIMFMPLLLPDAEHVLTQTGGLRPVIDWAGFSKDFVAGLVPVERDGVTYWPVWVMEDAGTTPRRRLILNAKGDIIAELPVPKDYDPTWWVKEHYPDLYEPRTTAAAADYRTHLEALFDGRRLVMRYDLIDGDNLLKLVVRQSIDAARRAEQEGGGVLLRGWEGGTVTNLQFVAIETTTNGAIELTIAWPQDGLAANMVDFFACTNLLEQDWVIALTTNVDLSTNCFSWVDEDSTNYTVRFYDCWTLDDTDGDGISDGREKRLYGTNPNAWDSDGDGLSDYDEIFVHGTDPLDADSDGDGLPDGWEVQYGLDPLDATGVNGANGDPDGDGFSNAQEYAMGGNPNNPAINATQLIHRLMHCRGGSSLRVDVEDSQNCGGSNPNRQVCTDTFSIGPLADCGYLLAVTVVGRVEDHNSGYDKVSVESHCSSGLYRDVACFEGHNNGNGCAMVNEQVTTNVWFWNNGSARLKYDTVDGLYHVGAYAEIVSASLVSTFEVLAIEPDAMTNLHEIADGDGNPRTRVFVVPIAQAMEWPVDPVVVRALISPEMDESELPDCMSLQGGSGSDKLTRYVSRTIQAGPSKTEFTFDCGGTNAGFTTTVYVYDAKVGLFANEGDRYNLNFGHSWGRYTLDAYASELVPSALRFCLDDIGFFPEEPANWVAILAGNNVPGDLRIGPDAYGSHYPTGWKQYPVLFGAISNALSEVYGAHSNPPEYNLYYFNCTDVAIGLGEMVDVPTMDSTGVSSPWAFSDWLNSN